jgi:hypothetical protein
MLLISPLHLSTQRVSCAVALRANKFCVATVKYEALAVTRLAAANGWLALSMHTACNQSLHSADLHNLYSVDA